ncbi:MAG: peptidoglycan DD-metalloendopeptidase family protein [Oscillospiraceae bacterium]|jgi:murein DD-endopeptidase MepM/ murein hydrolase activator NlpD|nr:peptidoglycan DD-metalloendopeptidase family protein [Oscillospiraceae bacterium]
MDDKKTFFQRLSDFAAGKGFYALLFVCFAAIGVSAYMLINGGGTDDTLTNTGGNAAQQQIQQQTQTQQTPAYMPDRSPAGSGVSGSPERAVTPEPPALSDSATKPAKREPGEAETGAVSAPETAEPDDAGEAWQAEATDADIAVAAPEKDPVFVWPLAGDVIFPYSVDELIYNRTMGDWRTHDGVDIAGGMGAKVVSAADGEVADVFDDDLLGTTVVVSHGKGIMSRYSNLAATPAVKKGDKITMGAVIGSLGDTALGESGEPTHLHFAMTRDGRSVDPGDYLP